MGGKTIFEGIRFFIASRDSDSTRMRLETSEERGALHMDLILLAIFAVLAVWTEIDKLRQRSRPE
jgi:hypothetical protein